MKTVSLVTAALLLASTVYAKDYTCKTTFTSKKDVKSGTVIEDKNPDQSNSILIEESNQHTYSVYRIVPARGMKNALITDVQNQPGGGSSILVSQKFGAFDFTGSYGERKLTLDTTTGNATLVIHNAPHALAVFGPAPSLESITTEQLSCQ